jgi:prephenate dehydrogenase
MTRLFDQVTIIGVGLIGGSLGLALRRKKLARRVVGVGHRQLSIDRALGMGAIDRGTLDPLEGVKGADLVVLGTAVRLIVEMGKRVAGVLSPGVIVTDVGSTKSEIVHRLEEALPAGVSFVGAHPIAGSEKRGIDAARPDLFQESVCVLTPTARTDPEAMRRVADLWTAVGARVSTLSCEEHDRVLARTSHLPHLAAAALVAAIEDPDTRFVGAGLRDTTRVAAGDVDVWCDIFMTNREAVLEALSGFTERVSELRRAVEAGDRDKLALLLAAAKSRRDSLRPE